MNAKGTKAGWSDKSALRSGYDFSSISIYPPAKIPVSQPGDPSEREADKIAEKVVQSPDIGEPKLKESKLPTKESTQGLDERETDETQIQPKLEKSYNPQSISSFRRNQISQVDHLKGEPQPLPNSVRSYFEARFQQNFGGVRLYTSSGAAQLAQFFNARAFTLGQDIVFGTGEYSPYTQEGKKLIAHELTHVLQHGNDRSAIYRKISFESPTFSHEDFVEKIMHKKDLALTTPTFNGTMLADTKRGKTPEEAKKLYDNAGQTVLNAFTPKTSHYDEKKKECAFNDFDVKVGAHIMLPNEPQGKKWRGYFPGPEIPGCNNKAGDVPVAITGDPDSASVYKIIQNQEQEHVEELKRIYGSSLEPYFKMVLNLTATGDDSGKCQKALSDALGKKDTLMAKGFLKDWGDSADNLDKGGRHTFSWQITPKGDCDHVEVVVKK